MNQHELNQQIESFLKDKSSRGIKITKEDLIYINKYEGSGGQGKNGAKGEGLLHEYYTPQFVCDIMWQLAYYYGYDGGNVLEPSCATGRMLTGAPLKAKKVGFEINPVSAKICELNNPTAQIEVGYFETAFMQHPRFTTRLPKNKVTWLDAYPFSLVIGNPPYGKYRNRYSSYFKSPAFAQIEQFFFYQGLEMLKPGGLLVYIVGSGFMRNGQNYLNAKQAIFEKAELLDAYRLPPVFASTEISTDIIILKKK